MGVDGGGEGVHHLEMVTEASSMQSSRQYACILVCSHCFNMFVDEC